MSENCVVTVVPAISTKKDRKPAATGPFSELIYVEALLGLGNGGQVKTRKKEINNWKLQKQLNDALMSLKDEKKEESNLKKKRRVDKIEGECTEKSPRDLRTTTTLEDKSLVDNSFADRNENVSDQALSPIKDTSRISPRSVTSFPCSPRGEFNSPITVTDKPCKGLDWHADNHIRLRKMVEKEILDVIQQKHNQSNYSCQSYAERLEKIMYYTAESLDMYLDRTTLYSRVVCIALKELSTFWSSESQRKI